MLRLLYLTCVIYGLLGDVIEVPVATVEFGDGVDPNGFIEGDDVYFHLTMAPDRYEHSLVNVTWFHNGQELHHDETNGVILSSRDLGLLNVTRHRAGAYSCQVTDPGGFQDTGPLFLYIMYEPTCTETSEHWYAASRNSPVDVLCAVYANPPVVTFQWTFNNSGEEIDVPSSKYTSNGTQSYLVHTPVGNENLICRGANSVGPMRTPCIYHIVVDPESENITEYLQHVPEVKPLDVTVLNKEEQISADKKLDVECRATGFKSNVTITWWKVSDQVTKIADTDYKQSYSENVTSSILSFVPDFKDDGKDLICRVENINNSDAAIEDKWTLNVQYVPRLLLRAQTRHGWKRKPRGLIEEGEDVRLKCRVLANPKPNMFVWFYDGRVIHHNEGHGFIMRNYSLIVQQVTRKLSGKFTCHAANSVGLGTSNAVPLNIDFRPTCKRPEEVYRVSKNDTVYLKCEFDANPPTRSHRWSALLVNSGGIVDSIPSSMYTNRGSVSYLNYTPLSDDDYGTLECLGFNRVKKWPKSCMYHVIKMD